MYHVVLNGCDSDYDLAVMDTLALERLWALGLVTEVPGSGQMLSLMRIFMCWCCDGSTIDALWTCMCLLDSISDDM